MKNRDWVELKNVNYRVIVNRHHSDTVKDMESLRDDLNDLFNDHKDWNDTHAEVDYDEIEYCKLCGEKYIPGYDEVKKGEVCQFCGEGLLEFCIKKLAGKVK